MEKAVSNQLTIKDLTAPVGPSTFGSGPNVAITSTAACADVQQTLTTLTQITVDVISAGSTIGLPTANVGTYTTGGLKCRRDLQYIVDGVAQDISYDTNQHTVRNTKFYFKPDGTQKLDGLIGEEDESIYIFESSADYMQLAITNNLNYKDLRIPIDPVTGVNTDPSNYADIQTDIDTLVGILTVAIGNSSLAGIPTVGFGTADCADVRFSLANYVGIATGIIGFGTTVAPEKYFPLRLEVELQLDYLHSDLRIIIQVCSSMSSVKVHLISPTILLILLITISKLVKNFFSLRRMVMTLVLEQLLSLKMQLSML